MQVAIVTQDEITVQFQWPSTITKEMYEDFLYQLEGFERKIARSVKNSEPGTAADSEESTIQP